MDSAFLNLARGNRLQSYLGLQMAPEKALRFSQDYVHADIPILEARNATTNELVPLDSVKGNARLKLFPACSVHVRKYRLQIDVHPSLLESADISHLQVIDPPALGEEPTQPVVYASFRKPADLSELPYLIRIRMLA